MIKIASWNVDAVERNKNIIKESIRTLTLLLAPFAPHLAEEFWSILKGEGSVHNQSWPIHDESALIENIYKLIIQINGKVRGFIEVKKDEDFDFTRDNEAFVIESGNFAIPFSTKVTDFISK